MPRIVDNNELAPGFIFVQSDQEIAPAYQVVRMGANGFFSMLVPDAINGHIPATYIEYRAAWRRAQK